MHLIAYTSRTTVPFTQADLASLRAFSASVNRVTGITGLLVFDGNRFMQALEGDIAAVNATMNRIINDQRHESIAYLENRETERRQFGEWSMEYRNSTHLANGNDFLARIKLCVANVEEDSTKAAFIGFAALSVRRWLKI